MLADETWPQWKGDQKEGVKKILEAQEIPTDEYAFGKSKIFIKNPKMVILKFSRLIAYTCIHLQYFKTGFSSTCT